MIKSVKKLALPFLAFILTAGTSQAFNDVTPEDWFHPYVHELVADGVFEDGETFNPNEELTRAEFIEVVVTALNGLEDFDVPTTPTFSDVPTDDPRYAYIEAGTAMGIIGGYTDINGDPIYVFGLNDGINRAAATKILVDAYEIEESLNQLPNFPDVSESEWFYNYVVTAFNNGIIQGYEDGTFGPADGLTRAQIAKLVVLSRDPDPSIKLTGEFHTVGDEVQETDGSSLILSLNPLQYPPMTVPLASAAPMLNFDLTASGGDVLLNNITFNRSGVGNNSDFPSIYIYLDGLYKITSEYSVKNDTNTVTIPFNLPIPEGATVNLLLYGDTGLTATPANQHIFSIDTAASINSSAEVVSGDFPLAGQQLTIGSQFANYIIMTPGSSLSSPKRDQISEVASFKIQTVDASDLALTLVVLNQGGSLSSEKITDCSLLEDDEVIAVSPGFIGDELPFILSANPHFLKAGTTKHFYVKCHVDTSAKSTETIQLYVDEIYDVLKTDLDYGFPAGMLNFYGATQAPTYKLKGAEVLVQ